MPEGQAREDAGGKIDCGFFGIQVPIYMGRVMICINEVEESTGFGSIPEAIELSEQIIEFRKDVFRV